MDFEEYVSTNYKRLEGQTREFVEDAYTAGQQSKQEEVNKLQKEVDALKSKINDLAKWAELHIKDYNSSESESEHDRGWFNAACQVFKQIKGNKNDT